MNKPRRSSLIDTDEIPAIVAQRLGQFASSHNSGKTSADTVRYG